MGDEAYEMDDTRETSDADAAGADREGEAPTPQASESTAERAGRDIGGAWDMVLALIEAVEAGKVVTLRGRDIRALRRAVRMPARELAQRLGYTESAVYDWETERHSCPPSRYLALLDAMLGWQAEQEQWMTLIHKDLRALRRREGR